MGLLYSLRKRRGLTQEEIARAISVSINTYRAWELGTRLISLVASMSLADFYKIPLGEFVEKYCDDYNTARTKPPAR